MAYSSSDARRELLDTLADGVDELGYALAALGAAYEQLDNISADTLEEGLFGPVQRAYGRAQRAHAGFAARHGLEGKAFEPQEAGVPSTGPKGFVESALVAVTTAAARLAEVQDAPEALEVGDAELRAALADVRSLIDPVELRGRDLMRRLGR